MDDDAPKGLCVLSTRSANFCKLTKCRSRGGRNAFVQLQVFPKKQAMNPFQPDRKFLCKTSSCSQAPKQREVGKGELNRHFVAAAPHSTHSLDSKDLLGHQLPRKVQFTEEEEEQEQ